jgi:glucose-6-phosphate 1-dehydrogenase
MGPIEPHTFVIFGGTGNLMRRKLLPAIYHLSAQGVLKDKTVIVGVTRRTDLDDKSFRVWAWNILETAGLSVKDPAFNVWCDKCLHYQSIGNETSEDYQRLATRLESIEKLHGLPGNRVFYLALPPSAFPTVTSGLGEAGMNRSSGWTRLVIEKPFGQDIVSAQELNSLVHRYFEEAQIYRIDHFLGKETVQNLLVFRFGNTLFEHTWNRNHIEKVEISVAESLGIEGRAGYYEKTGALRDMVQNHLTQLLTLMAMEIPTAFEADDVRNEKVKVLRQIEPIQAEDVVFGQYTGGKIDGQDVISYRKEPNVSPDSSTETFVAMRIKIANWRWHGVPFYLRTGKRMNTRLTQIRVTFHSPPVSVFQPFEHSQPVAPNVLVITLQPDEGFDLHFQVKSPGQPTSLKTQQLQFRYQDTFGSLPDAYETLLLDVIAGDQTLFVRADETEEAWRLYSLLPSNSDWGYNLNFLTTINLT